MLLIGDMCLFVNGRLFVYFFIILLILNWFRIVFCLIKVFEIFLLDSVVFKIGEIKYNLFGNGCWLFKRDCIKDNVSVLFELLFMIMIFWGFILDINWS